MYAACSAGCEDLVVFHRLIHMEMHCWQGVDASAHHGERLRRRTPLVFCSEWTSAEEMVFTATLVTF